MPACHYCGKQIVGTLYQRACGWAKQRSDGGTNALRLRRTSDAYACHPCLDLLDAGVDPRTQPPLFPDA